MSNNEKFSINIKMAVLIITFYFQSKKNKVYNQTDK